MYPRIQIRRGVEKKIRNYYPLVFKEEISRTFNIPRVVACIADLQTWKGNFLARGYFCGRARIPFRVLTLKAETIDHDFFYQKLRVILEAKRKLMVDMQAYRLVHGEADGLPGLIIDVYGDVVVVQVRTSGMEALREQWTGPLFDLLRPVLIYERSDMPGRLEEGLKPAKGVIMGQVTGLVDIRENCHRFTIDYENGSKTGFYLDQRDNRRMVSSYVHDGDRVLDLFCYTGGFSVYVGKAGGRVTAVDTSKRALEIAGINAGKNTLEGINFIHGNAFDFIEARAGAREKYDMIILDPPAIAKTRKQKKSLKWAIWKLVYNAVKCLNSGGRVAVFNCSYQLDDATFNEAVRLAGADTGRMLKVLEEFRQARDHTWILQFPESLYLRGLLLEVL